VYKGAVSAPQGWGPGRKAGARRPDAGNLSEKPLYIAEQSYHEQKKATSKGKFRSGVCRALPLKPGFLLLKLTAKQSTLPQKFTLQTPKAASKCVKQRIFSTNNAKPDRLLGEGLRRLVMPDVGGLEIGRAGYAVFVEQAAKVRGAPDYALPCNCGNQSSTEIGNAVSAHSMAFSVLSWRLL
jgi:hypothetical protein